MAGVVQRKIKIKQKYLTGKMNSNRVILNLSLLVTTRTSLAKIFTSVILQV
jgi:hypothetical protein